MSSNKMTEGVGKKIVEALKQQSSDVDIIPVAEATESMNISDINTVNIQNEYSEETPAAVNTYDEANSNITSSLNMANAIDNAFNRTMLNFRQPMQDNNLSAVDDMDLPTNVAVLKQLITKIPAGVSKQTGALIIKQTMEALGISMTNVLQEAQQVQETLTQSVKDCQNNVLEYKKQINMLEVQAQKYQRQFAAINDIISLFIQTGN
ncbi:MAG: hypothetical protein VZR09_09565 [Candidatus Gastranaerophilaceae bacterium]|nr:hypothetical protein [Candidatus Gastranaerophilaceae bacterium]